MKTNQKSNKKGTKEKNVGMTDNNSKSAAASGEISKGKKKGQQLPAKKASDSKTKKQVKKDNVFKLFAQFLREAKTELKKVKWPTRKELLASTTMVIILVLVIALYLGLVDIGLINIINRIVG
jgi:preprotein translocase subunit SecE